VWARAGGVQERESHPANHELTFFSFCERSSSDKLAG